MLPPVLEGSSPRGLGLTGVLLLPSCLSRDRGALAKDGAVGETIFADPGLVSGDPAFPSERLFPLDPRAISLASPAVMDDDKSSEDESPRYIIARRTPLGKPRRWSLPA